MNGEVAIITETLENLGVASYQAEEWAGIILANLANDGLYVRHESEL